MPFGTSHYGEGWTPGRAPIESFQPLKFSQPHNGTIFGKSEKTVGESRKSDSFPVKVHDNETGKREIYWIWMKGMVALG